ncbi:hypothetical protein MTO96_000434 [Rhipicephalus appendiculatus]
MTIPIPPRAKRQCPQSPQPDVPTGVLSSPASASAASLLKKALERASSGRTCSVQYRRLGSPEVTAVALTCALFETALAGLTQLRLDILTGLCHHEWVLCQLWQLIRSVGPASGVRAFLDLLAFTTKPSGPEFRLLVLFCDCATHLVTILDDLELYEQQRPLPWTTWWPFRHSSTRLSSASSGMDSLI